jgi:hypothetical protein
MFFTTEKLNTSPHLALTRTASHPLIPKPSVAYVLLSLRERIEVRAFIAS